ncbi:hypothetical protein NHQ30_004621 [Ciborinia camelliae]|nr:hypothetical protein NHQ30_004621 [Ciborinia camelliae]
MDFYWYYSPAESDNRERNPPPRSTNNNSQNTQAPDSRSSKHPSESAAHTHQAPQPTTADPDSSECPICLCSFPAPTKVVFTYPCHHEYCLQCIQHWIVVQKRRRAVQTPSCPVCRAVIQRLVERDGKLVEELAMDIDSLDARKDDCKDCKEDGQDNDREGGKEEIMLGNISRTSEGEPWCSICHDYPSPISAAFVTPCHHRFHLGCIEKLIIRAPNYRNCPNCRTKMKTVEVNGQTVIDSVEGLCQQVERMREPSLSGDRQARELLQIQEQLQGRERWVFIRDQEGREQLRIQDQVEFKELMKYLHDQKAQKQAPVQEPNGSTRELAMILNNQKYLGLSIIQERRLLEELNKFLAYEEVWQQLQRQEQARFMEERVLADEQHEQTASNRSRNTMATCHAAP